MDLTRRFSSLLREPYPSKSIPKTKIPIFAARKKKDREKDKYDKDFEYVDRYTGLFAFAHLLFRHGGGEGLYRTIDCALLANLDRKTEHSVLDIGCGVGRMLYDCADLFPNTFFVGMDYAYNMCIRARQILVSGKEIPLAESLAHTGLGTTGLLFTKTKKSENIFLAQGSVMDLPFNDDSFDCVVNTYLIDRVEDPRLAVTEMARVLKPGGLFVLSDPLSFEKAAPQNIIPDASALVDVITRAGIEITEHFDQLVYREMKDARGNYNDFQSFVCVGRKQ
jgi:ubiquinone/menaquinone biosynthesis C-methylase UbiE